MNITSAAIRNNRLTLLALLALVAAGIGAYGSLPRAEDPGFTVRTAIVQTFFPGASPIRVEQLVTDKLEKTIQEMPELDFLSSQSRTGNSLIFVNIKESYQKRAMRGIWDNLRRKVDAARGDLPDEVIGPIVNDEFGDVFPIMLTITGDGFTYAELKDVADEMRDELLHVRDVAKIEIYGAQDERVFVEYNNARLAELGVSPVQLQSILGARNIVIPGGTVTAGIERLALEPSGSFESIDDLRRSVVTLPGSREVIYLQDIADVYRGYIDPPEAILHSDGTPALGLSISIREGGNVTVGGNAVRDRIHELVSEYPIGVDFDLVIFQPDYVNSKVNAFMVSLAQAVGIVLLVMLVSLGLRTGLVVASLIPIAMLATLMVMGLLKIGLDQISIAALIIALGMLVDNAIVMSESIMVQIAEGKDRFRAAVDSAVELRVPLLVSSLTTSAAFLPIFLADSAVGEYCASLFKVVTIALLASWVLSLTMMPLLCMYFVRVKTQTDADTFDTPFYRQYRHFLMALLRHRFLTVAGVVGLFILAMVGMGFIPNIFFPRSDAPRMTAELDLPVGTAIERTQEVVNEIEQHLTDEFLVTGDRTEGFSSWTTYIGSRGGPRYRLSYPPAMEGSEHASLILSATSRKVITDAIPRLREYCDRSFPALIAEWSAEQMGPPVEKPVQVRIMGSDIDRLFQIVDQVKAKLAETPGTRNITDTWGPRTKKLLVTVNAPRARRAQVTNQDIAISLQTVLSGLETTDFREDDKIIPVTLRSVAADRQDVGKLESMNVYSQASGRSVPLKQVADIDVAWEPAEIIRRDRFRNVIVECDVDGVSAIDVVQSLEPWLDESSADWGVGYRYELGGEIESSAEASSSIMAAMPIAFFIILLLLVGQFNSMRRTTIVLLTIPLGLIGVTVGLLVTRLEFGFMTLLGVISLAGIIINNAIVLLDRIRIEVAEHGVPEDRAIIESAQRRLRPILLTSFTTVGGLIPLWLGGGPMWEAMSVAIIFGLLFATLLTLGVVPVLYSLFFRVSFRDFRY